MNRVCSIFAQLLELFPRVKFQDAVRKHKAERHSRGFSGWGQFVAILFCQAGARAIAAGYLQWTGGERREAEASGNSQGAEEDHPGLCQWASELGVV